VLLTRGACARVRHATESLKLSNKMTVKRHRTMEGEQEREESSHAAAVQAPSSSQRHDETETFDEPFRFLAGDTVESPRDTHSLHVHNSTAAPAGRRGSTCAPNKAKNHTKNHTVVRQACWPGVGRLALGTWLVRAWVLTRVIVRVCEPCVPPLSLKRSPELFLPVVSRLPPVSFYRYR
jgi:hypothetical protein